MVKEHMVQGTDRPRAFVLGHIGRAHIVTILKPDLKTRMKVTVYVLVHPCFLYSYMLRGLNVFKLT